MPGSPARPAAATSRSELPSDGQHQSDDRRDDSRRGDSHVELDVSVVQHDRTVGGPAFDADHDRGQDPRSDGRDQAEHDELGGT